LEESLVVGKPLSPDRRVLADAINAITEWLTVGASRCLAGLAPAHEFGLGQFIFIHGLRQQHLLARLASSYEVQCASCLGCNRLGAK
jgi:hypothetical protein